MTEITLTKTNFDSEVLHSSLPVLVDFWATWCGPCRMVAPIVAELAQEYSGILKVGKIDVDQEPELANRFGIASIPTLMVFRDGALVKTIVGYRNKEQLLSLIF